MIDELRLELKYYEKRRAEHLADIAAEEKYYATHPDDYFMLLEEVVFYRFWQIQLEICTEAIIMFKQEISKFYE